MTTAGSSAGEARYLIDTYRDFISAEGVPIVEAFGIDLLHVDTAPWPRIGAVNGAYALTSGAPVDAKFSLATKQKAQKRTVY